MRECAQCSYLLAPEWTTCKRCGAATGAAPRSVPAPPPPPTPTPEPASQWNATPVTTAAPPSSSYDPRFATTARIGFDAPTSNSGWSPPTEGPPVPVRLKGRSWKRVAIGVFAVVLVFAGFNYWQKIRSAPPGALAGYVDGKGIEYAPDGLGYSIRLPEKPDEDSATQTAQGVEVQAYTAIADGDNWEVVVGVIVLPVSIEDVMTEPELRDAVEREVQDDALFAGGKVEELTTGTFDGHPAIEVKLEAPDDNPFYAKFILVGDTMYVYGAHAVRGTEKVFDEMDESFELTGTGV